MKAHVIFLGILFTIGLSHLTTNGSGGVFFLGAEPLVRIGLTTNASSVSITTSDSQLVAYSLDEPNRYLATNRVSVSARAIGRPRSRIIGSRSRTFRHAAEADELAKDVREETGETALVSIDPATNTWKVWIGSIKETTEESDAFKAMLAEKGFEDVVIVTEKKVVPSEDAVELSQQLRTAGKSEVRSLDQDDRHVERHRSGCRRSESARSDRQRPERIGEILVAQIRFVRLVQRTGESGSAQRQSLSRQARGFCQFARHADGRQCRAARRLSARRRAGRAWPAAPRSAKSSGGRRTNLRGRECRTHTARRVSIWCRPSGRRFTKAFRSRRRWARRPFAKRAAWSRPINGKPIMAYFTSTCGGRTENVENIFDTHEPYLRGVECSLEGHRHFDPFLIKTVRTPAKLRDEENLELVRLMSLLAVNGFSLTTNQMTDDWFDEAPTRRRDVELAEPTRVAIRQDRFRT